MTKSMDIVNYSQCHPVERKNNRKTSLNTPIGATATSTVRRTPATSTVTSRDYYQNQQQQQRLSESYTVPSTYESTYFSNTYDYSTVNANNINNNNVTKTSDYYDFKSKMYQEMSSFYHHPHHRTCAGYNVPPAAYEMRSFGPMSAAMTAPNVQMPLPPPSPPPQPPPPLSPPSLPPMAIPIYQRPHHETRGHHSSMMRPHIESNYSNESVSASSPSTIDAWYQPPSVSAADQMINMLYMNNR